MEKGKLSKENKVNNEISLMLVPHSAAEVKVLRISSPLSKFAATLIVVLLTIAYLLVFTIRMANENKNLKGSVAALTNMNVQQHKLLKSKASEFKKLADKKEEIDQMMRAFTSKYREATEVYLSDRIDVAETSRSGDSIDRAYVNELIELRGLLSELRELNSNDEGLYGDLMKTEKELTDYIDSIPTVNPAPGPISSEFGGRRDPLTRRTAYHEGIDIAADFGVRIKAAASGKVIFAGRDKVLGKCVKIDHGNGIVSIYGHSSTLLVKKGAIVKKGDSIAKVGSSGRSTGSHLHFEIQVNGTPVDPLEYIDR